MLNNLNYQNSKKWIFYLSFYPGFVTVLWPQRLPMASEIPLGFKFELLDFNYICSHVNLSYYCEYFKKFELVRDRS